ncbi:MAG: hypothetical protein JW861_11240 [Bacteroidales bacterium]|nr:hypothetical protein [Bacteroidales bacterium]
MPIGTTMTYQERKNIVNIVSAVLIMGIYALVIYHRHQAGRIDLVRDYTQWGVIFLIFIAFFGSCLTADIVDNLSQIYYYRKGV